MGNAETWCAENGSNPRADSDRNLLRPSCARRYADAPRHMPRPARPQRARNAHISARNAYATRTSSSAAYMHMHHTRDTSQGDDQSGGRPSHVLSISHPLDLEPWFGTAFGSPTPPMCLKMRRGEGGGGGGLTHSRQHANTEDAHNTRPASRSCTRLHNAPSRAHTTSHALHTHVGALHLTLCHGHGPMASVKTTQPPNHQAREHERYDNDTHTHHGSRRRLPRTNPKR